MFYHVVMMQLTADVGSEFHRTVEHYVGRIRAECGGVIRYEYCANVASRGKDYSYVVLSVFESPEAHDRYQVSLPHQELKAYVTPFVLDIVVFDGEVPRHTSIPNVRQEVDSV